jgi:hypothetical protein
MLVQDVIEHPHIPHLFGLVFLGKTTALASRLGVFELFVVTAVRALGGLEVPREIRNVEVRGIRKRWNVPGILAVLRLSGTSERQEAMLLVTITRVVFPLRLHLHQRNLAALAAHTLPLSFTRISGSCPAGESNPGEITELIRAA